MKNPASLLHRIHRRFPTTTEMVRFGAVEFSFTRAADPNRVLDEVAAEEDRRERLGGARIAEPLHLPYWAELWDSGGGIALHLARNYPNQLASHSVLDLGCGQGLTGCVAAALGARVMFADLEAPALLFAQLNASPWMPRIRTRRLNWQTDQLDERFEFIIGADILYERAQWVFLEPFWRRHLAGDGKIILGEPGRPTGDAFGDWIAQRGWSVTALEQKIATRERPIRIFELQAGIKS